MTYYKRHWSALTSDYTIKIKKYRNVHTVLSNTQVTLQKRDYQCLLKRITGNSVALCEEFVNFWWRQKT